MQRLRRALGLGGGRGTDVDASVSPTTGAGATAPSGGVGLFVDGPNVLREEFSVDLDDVRDAATAHGPLAVSRCYLDENAPASLIRAAEARGFEVVVTSGDVDVRLAVDATAAIVEGGLDAIVLASRDTDFKPVLEAARKRGVHSVALSPGEYGSSDALANAADEAEVLEER